MTIIPVATIDRKIWNQHEIYSEIALAMCKNKFFTLDFLDEGPDLRNLGIIDFLEKASDELNFPLKNITICTANIFNTHPHIKIIYKAPFHLLQFAKDYIDEVPKAKVIKKFGIFIGRSNALRLSLASYIYSNYQNQSLINYHFNIHDDFHSANIGLEEIMRQRSINDVKQEAELLKNCPLKTNIDVQTIIIDKSLSINPAQQLFLQDKSLFTQLYKNFLVEIVCESYFTGQTFFPTEKTWRPILLKTPFMVQGPVNFLKNLKSLGFKTFNDYWDESYDEDPSWVAVQTIKNNLDTLSKLNDLEIYEMYLSMKDILEHNYKLALTITSKDFHKINDQK